jgi:hypothetical protein
VGSSCFNLNFQTALNLANGHACACDHPRHPCQRVRCEVCHPCSSRDVSTRRRLPDRPRVATRLGFGGMWHRSTLGRISTHQPAVSATRSKWCVCGGGCESPALGLCVHVNSIVVRLPACRLMACAALGEWVCALAALRLHFVNSFCAFL